MAVDLYAGKAEIYLNGRLLAEAQSINLTVNSNDIQVGTIQKGFAGFSDGATNCEAQIDSAVPRKGFEMDFQRAVAEKKTIVLVLKITATQKIRAAGRLTTAQNQSGFNTETKASTTFMGGKPDFIG